MLLLLLPLNCTGPHPLTISASSQPQISENRQPGGNAHHTFNRKPWSSAESADATRAVRIGLDELIAYFDTHPDSVTTLAENAVQCFLDISHAAGNMPALKTAAQSQARAILARQLAPYLDRDPASVSCWDYPTLLDLTVYAHTLLSTDNVTMSKMVTLTNAAWRDCGSLSEAMGYDYRRILTAETVSVDDIYDLVMWCISLIDALRVPKLELSNQTTEFISDLWRFLERYPLVNAQAYPKGANDRRFYDTAYLATHIGYIPTGYGRHSINIADTHWLYRFLRENFYAVLKMGELDLVAEFVDLLRQYGFTEENDEMVRDGTRYLLGLFHAGGDSWMAHREPYETTTPNDYDLIHKAWTGVAGVKSRLIEPSVAGTYGSVFRSITGRSQR